VSLPAGIYKIRSRAGRQEQEQIVLVDRTQTISLASEPEFVSPAPLLGTSRTHEAHMDAAERLSREIHARAGSGAQVFLCARWWTSSRKAGATVLEHPGAGITLSYWDGTPIAVLESVGVSDATAGDPFVGRNIELDPGAYILRRPGPAGAILEQTIVASRDWQTQVFLLKRETESRSGDAGTDPAALHVDDVSVLMTRGGFDRGREDMRLAELARLALADERRILSQDLRQMAEGKFENPMLGIFAAHILDLSLGRQLQDDSARERAAVEQRPAPAVLETRMNASDLNVLVDNLRMLVGYDHPDVEALSLRCPDPARRTAKPLSAAPMLRRSWSVFVAASNKNPGLVPLRLWNRVSALTALVPYLAWLHTPTGSTRVDAAEQVALAVTAGEEGAVKPTGRVPNAKRAAKAPAALVFGARTAQGISKGGERRPAAPLRPRRISSSLKQSVSMSNDIPRAAVDRAFREL